MGLRASLQDTVICRAHGPITAYSGTGSTCVGSLESKVRGEWQTHGYEVDLIGAYSEKLVLATVKSFFGSRGVVSEHVMGEKGYMSWYALLNQPDIREGVVKGACERFGYRFDQVEMRLYVGKSAGGGHESRIRDWAASQQIGGCSLQIIGADRVVAKVREVASSKQYRDSPVLVTLKVLEATGALSD